MIADPAPSNRDKTQIKPYFIVREGCPACQSTKIITRKRADLSARLFKAYFDSCYLFDEEDRLYLQGGEYILDECTGCGFIYQREVPDARMMSVLYEKWLDPAVTFAMENGLSVKNVFTRLRDADEVLRLILFLHRAPGGIRVLDFGMGWAHWCRMARQFGCEVYGTEISAERVAYARKHGVKVITAPALPAGRFDFINAEQVFEHLVEPMDTLLTLKEALKSGGIIKISVPDGADIEERLRHFDWESPVEFAGGLNAVAPLEHINCFNKGVLLKMAERAGLEVINGPSLINLSLPYLAKAVINPSSRSLRVYLRKR